jgi:hypothetical protein
MDVTGTASVVKRSVSVPPVVREYTSQKMLKLAALSSL